MSNFIVLGLGKKSVHLEAIFRDVADGKVPNAHYQHVPPLYASRFRVIRFLTGQKIKQLAHRNLMLKLLLSPVSKAASKLPKSINLQPLRPLLSKTEENYIIICLGTNYNWLKPELVQALKSEPLCHHLILYLIDSVDNNARACQRSLDELLIFFQSFDRVFTYDAGDAELYHNHMQFVDIPLWKTAIATPRGESAVPATDLYFCGKNKCRLDIITAVRDRLIKAGLKCNYLLTTWDPSITSEGGIPVRHWVPYAETIGGILETNCILEVLSENNRASTLRYKEAVIYNKKLLTNNPNITGLPYYDSRWMRVFQTAEDIDLEWLHAVEPVDYGYRGDYSAETFLHRVEELTRNPKT